MRCPKCGYTSFDHLETCKKCQKTFGPLAEEVNGTTYEAMAPLFLKITKELEEKTIRPPVEPLNFDEIEIEEDQSSSVRLGIDTEFVLDQAPFTDIRQENIAFPEEKEELVVDLDEFEEVAPREEFTLDLDGKSGEDDSEAQLPPLDFGDLDISDLAPPANESAHEPSLPLELDTVQDDTTPPAAKQPPHPRTTEEKSKRLAGLEDLNFNGLDLESPAKIVSGSAAGKRYLPSVKTGTALDKFDIDLGDLFADKKIEKNN
jgi:hypothetical protein